MTEKTSDLAKRVILQCLAEGMTVEKACIQAGKSIKTYEYYRSSDKGFAALADRTRLGVKTKNFTDADVHDITYAEFCERFLNHKVFAHQQNLVDVIEGKEPGWLHPAMKYEKGVGDNRILINIPPNHAKSISITVDYVTYRIVQNPNFRVLIVSQTQQLAADFLYAIKQRLTAPMYENLHRQHMPVVGSHTLEP